MRSTKGHLRGLDAVDVPDDWEDATTRTVRDPLQQPGRRPRARTRIAAVAVGLAVSLASVWFLVATFSPTPPPAPPVGPSPSASSAAPTVDGWAITVSLDPSRIGPLRFTTGPVREAKTGDAHAWVQHTISITNVGSRPVFVRQTGRSSFLGGKRLLAGDWGCGYGSSGPNAPVHAGACILPLIVHTVEPDASLSLVVGLSKDLPGMQPVTSGVYTFRQPISFTLGGGRFAAPASKQVDGTLRVTYTIRPSTATGSPVPSDPCALLGRGQIESATGGRVLAVRRLTPADLKFSSPGSPLPCAYMTDSAYGSILVTTDPAGAATYAKVRARDPANNQMLAGLGEEAFVSGKASIWVKVGDGYFSISAQMGAGDASVAMLESLARDALGIATPAPTVPSARPSESVSLQAARCHLGELRLGLGPVSEATGQHSQMLSFTNSGSTPCSLHGYPVVAVLDAAGTPVPFRYRRGGDEMVTSRPPATVTLGPGGIAYVMINKYRCDAGNEQVGDSLVVSLPGGTSRVTAPIGQRNDFSYCGIGDPGSIISISPFEPTAAATSAH